MKEETIILSLWRHWRGTQRSWVKWEGTGSIIGEWERISRLTLCGETPGCYKGPWVRDGNDFSWSSSEWGQCPQWKSSTMTRDTHAPSFSSEWPSLHPCILKRGWACKQVSQPARWLLQKTKEGSILRLHLQCTWWLAPAFGIRGRCMRLLFFYFFIFLKWRVPFLHSRNMVYRIYTSQE